MLTSKAGWTKPIQTACQCVNWHFLIFEGKQMKSYPNIDKSAFRKGEYVGYSNGKVFHIRKSNSSFGNWHAANRDNWNEQLFAFGLASMSDKLANIK